ncbi:hypothetical protein TWF696_009044 [Orbilia brochopaga]|uniref:HNH nuclease domain-containing protein n=1 Tax=Orbilia brochopaga TaxID=3140254 RepID=A0AAV9UFL4_9PEZI
MLYAVELATMHMLSLETKSLSLPDAFRMLSMHIADIRTPNPDNYDNGWRDLEISLPAAIKASAHRSASQDLQFDCHGVKVSVAHLIHALVTYSYDTAAVAWDLYGYLVADANVKRVLERLVVLDGDGGSRTAWARPVEGTWAQAAGMLVMEADVTRALTAWARSWFDGLLVPFMTNGGAKSADTISPETSDRLREQLLARDGPITVVGSIVDRSFLGYPTTVDPSHYRAAGALSPAHIIPLAATTNPHLRSLLEIFAGGKVTAAELTRKRINDASNTLLLTHDQIDDLGEFIFSIETDESPAATGYSLRVYTMLTGPSLNGCHDRDDLYFAEYQDEHDNGMRVPLPDPRFCNIHTAIAKVVHGAGAGPAIAAVMSQERTANMQDAAATVEIWGNGGWEYLQRELRCLAANPVDDIDVYDV